MKVARRKDVSQTIKFGHVTIDADITLEQLKAYEEKFPGLSQHFIEVEINIPTPKAAVAK